MMELGSGIAIAGLCVSGGAVAITAIRTYSQRTIVGGTDGVNGINGHDGRNGNDGHDSISFPCREHSGIVVALNGIKESQDKQEKWMSDISKDVRRILEK